MYLSGLDRIVWLRYRISHSSRDIVWGLPMLHCGLTRPRPAAEGSPDEIRSTLDQFLRSCREPALLEPGEDLFPLAPENFTLDIRGSRLTLQAWDHTRNLTRRLISARLLAEGRLELTVERFPKKQGPAYLLDLARRSGAELASDSALT